MPEFVAGHNGGITFIKYRAKDYAEAQAMAHPAIAAWAFETPDCTIGADQVEGFVAFLNDCIVRGKECK